MKRILILVSTTLALGCSWDKKSSNLASTPALPQKQASPEANEHVVVTLSGPDSKSGISLVSAFKVSGSLPKSSAGRGTTHSFRVLSESGTVLHSGAVNFPVAVACNPPKSVEEAEARAGGSMQAYLEDVEINIPVAKGAGKLVIAPLFDPNIPAAELAIDFDALPRRKAAGGFNLIEKDGFYDIVYTSYKSNDEKKFNERVDRSMNQLKNMEPFKSLGTKVRWHRYFPKDDDLDCFLLFESFPACSSTVIDRLAAAGIPNDSVIVIWNQTSPKNIEGGATGKIAVSFVGSVMWSTIAHELGHTFGLNDEYPRSTTAYNGPPQTDANCHMGKLPAHDWEGLDVSYNKICGNTNFYRSSKNSVMFTLQTGDPRPFNAVSQALIRGRIRYLTNDSDTPILESAEVLDDGSIRVKWKPNRSVSSIYVQMQKEGSTSWQEYHTERETFNTVRVIPQLFGMTIKIRVTAISIAGESLYSEIKEVVTPYGPPRDAAVTVSLVDGGIGLSWEASPVANGFRISRKINKTGEQFADIADVGKDVLTYTDTAVEPATQYIYRVQAYNAEVVSPGRLLSSGIYAADVPLLQPMAEHAPDGRVKLTWNNLAGERRYEIQWSSDGVNWETIDSVRENITSGIPDKAAPELRYYRVRAIPKYIGLSEQYSPSVQFTALPASLGKPVLLATSISGTTVELRWEPIVGAESYRIRRTNQSDTSFVEYDFPLGQHQFTDENLPSGIRYRYWLQAVVNGAVTGEASDPLSIDISDSVRSKPSFLPKASHYNDAPSINLEQISSGSFEQGRSVLVERKKGSGGSWHSIDYLPHPSIEGWATDINIEPDTEYSYRIRIRNNMGLSEYSDVRTVTSYGEIPNPPAFKVELLDDNRVKITWERIDGVPGFAVERREGSSSFSSLNTDYAFNNYYIDNDTAPDTTYSYRIKYGNTLKFGVHRSDPVEITTGPAPPAHGLEVVAGKSPEAINIALSNARDALLSYARIEETGISGHIRLNVSGTWLPETRVSGEPTAGISLIAPGWLTDEEPVALVLHNQGSGCTVALYGIEKKTGAILEKKNLASAQGACFLPRLSSTQKGHYLATWLVSSFEGASLWAVQGSGGHAFSPQRLFAGNIINYDSYIDGDNEYVTGEYKSTGTGVVVVANEQQGMRLRAIEFSDGENDFSEVFVSSVVASIEKLHVAGRITMWSEGQAGEFRLRVLTKQCSPYNLSLCSGWRDDGVVGNSSQTPIYSTTFLGSTIARYAGGATVDRYASSTLTAGTLEAPVRENLKIRFGMQGQYERYYLFAGLNVISGKPVVEYFFADDYADVTLGEEPIPAAEGFYDIFLDNLMRTHRLFLKQEPDGLVLYDKTGEMPKP